MFIGYFRIRDQKQMDLIWISILRKKIVETIFLLPRFETDLTFSNFNSVLPTLQRQIYLIFHLIQLRYASRIYSIVRNSSCNVLTHSQNYALTSTQLTRYFFYSSRIWFISRQFIYQYGNLLILYVGQRFPRTKQPWT